MLSRISRSLCVDTLTFTRRGPKYYLTLDEFDPIEFRDHRYFLSFNADRIIAEPHLAIYDMTAGEYSPRTFKDAVAVWAQGARHKLIRSYDTNNNCATLILNYANLQRQQRQSSSKVFVP